jgi:excisionase family DNA binding protein
MSEEVESEQVSEFMRVNEAAAMWKVSPRTVWRMIAEGQLKAYRLRRCTRLLRSQVVGYLNGSVKVGGV